MTEQLREPIGDHGPEFVAAWWETDMDASKWWSYESVSALHAALVLCGHNPNKDSETNILKTAETVTGGGIGPDDFRTLKHAFESASIVKRTLKEWSDYAQERGLKIGSWFEGWVKSSNIDKQPFGARPLTRKRAQEQEIVSALCQLGYVPVRLPKPPQGMAGPKAEVRKILGNKGMWSGATVFDKAWERLRANEEICDKPSSP